MGGVRYPSSRFGQKDHSHLYRVMPNRAAIGWISGTIMMIAENTSMNEPFTSKTRFSKIRKTYLEWICASTQLVSVAGNVHDRQIVSESFRHSDD